MTEEHSLNVINDTEEQLVRGFFFACTAKSEAECLKRLLFGTEKTYGPIVLRIRSGDLLFLNNLTENTLLGIFKAVSNGSFNIQPDAWKGKYPYQVKVDILGEKLTLDNAEKILADFKIKRSTPLFGKKLINFLDLFTPNKTLLNVTSRFQKNETANLILKEKNRIIKRINERDIEDEISLLEPTTLWDFPKQNYGLTPKGDNKYLG